MNMKGHALKISSAAIALIKKHQGLSLEKYRDENGLWVIGYGHVIHEEDNFHGALLRFRQNVCRKIFSYVSCCGKI
jgi:GH24 family phage-related lysozyme (muramidase)